MNNNEELNNYFDALNKEHSDFIQKWSETQDKSELDEYISHLTKEEKDALFTLLILLMLTCYSPHCGAKMEVVKDES